VGGALRAAAQFGDAETIEDVTRSERAKGSGLGERLSVFWGTPATLRGNAEGGRFPPLDRLDLIEHGRLLLGADARQGLARPGTHELLVAGAEFALESLAGVRSPAATSAGRPGSLRPAGTDASEEIRSPDLLLARGVRRLTKLVLFPVRFLFTAASGRVGTNEDAVAWYLALDGAPAARLVAAAFGWRAAAPTDGEDVAGLLGDQMRSLYLFYINDHVARLDASGDAELARAFADWRTRITG